MPLRVHAPDAPPSTPARVVTRDRPAEPLPILYHHSQHADDDGPYVDTTIVWNEGDGTRCRFCSPGKCTFKAGREGLGACVVRRRGELSVIAIAGLPAGD